MNEELLRRENEILKIRLRVAQGLLAEAVTYVESHYLRSAAGFGLKALALTKKIKDFLGGQ